MNNQTATAMSAVKYSAEQAARALLDRMGVPNAREYSSGDLAELANLIAASGRIVVGNSPDLRELAQYFNVSATTGRPLTLPASSCVLLLAAMTTENKASNPLTYSTPAPAATSGDAPADLQQLKALALAATPGEWEVFNQQYSVCAADGSVFSIASCDGAAVGKNWSGTDYATAEHRRSNAAYIAAASPAVVLGLIARIERAASPATASGDEPLTVNGILVERADVGPACRYLTEHTILDGQALQAAWEKLVAFYVANRARAAVSAATKPDADELTFNAVRLRNVARLVGLEKSIPEDDATLDGARGAVLGLIAGALRDAATKPTADIAHWEGLTDLFGIIAAKHGINDIQVNGGTADELFPRVLAEFIVAASRGAEPDYTFEHLAGRGLHELHADELPAYLASVAHNFGARSTEFTTAAQWVAAEIERKTNDERILAVKLADVQSLLATKPAGAQEGEGA